MLFHVHMVTRVPYGMDPETLADLQAKERAHGAPLQENGTWRHLWRVSGKYENISVFNVSGPGELHEILTGLPLYQFMDITVTALSHHPGSVLPDDGA
ncbi:muconolactone Delta-isomerase [Streptomyces sp. NPDC020794]|jgi:muconolactone D-isomerase|uniref:muconolactone Delta-isomerase n=1 Tax=unclassified Streptomyces TaxID=2593676 RepID=UPI0036E69772